MNPEHLQNKLKGLLAPVLNESGAILFSSIETLKKGTLYTMGLNPGGSAEIKLSQIINELPTKMKNSYLEERWENDHTVYHVGQHPLQKNMTGMLRTMGFDPCDVFSTNLIFTRSRNSNGANYTENADLCWPAHKEFIKIVNPEVFLVFGNSVVSPYRYILNHYKLRKLDEMKSGHGNGSSEWMCYAAKGDIEGRERLLIGLPHLSRYWVIKHEEVIKWMKLMIQL